MRISHKIRRATTNCLNHKENIFVKRKKDKNYGNDKRKQKEHE